MSTAVFAAWFRKQLASRGWSQSEFHRRSGVARSTVSTWATGLRLPDPESIDLIADVLGLQVDTVLTVAGHRPATEAIDPNDPRELLAQRVRRTQFEGTDIQTLNSILDVYDNRNRKAREEKKG